MSFWSKGDKKGKKNEKVTTTKSMTVSRSDGDMVHSTTVTSFTRQESSMSQTTTEIRSTRFGSTSSMASQNSMNVNGSNTSLPTLGAVKNSIFDQPIRSNITIDALPVSASRFQSSPARSAFFSTPMTSTPSSSSNLGYRSPYLNTPNSTNLFDKRPSLPTITQKSVSTPMVSTRSVQNDAEEFRNKLKVKVVKSTQFYDDESQSKVPMYKTRSKNRGKLLLINNIEFAKEKLRRKGAELDEENVADLFRQMGFDVVKYRNLTKKQMEEKITNFRKNSALKKFDIAAVIVMSHGTGKERSDSTEVACTDEQLLETTWIINQFDSIQCPQLSGKPKIFIFQCCRGDSRDIEHDAVPLSTTTKPRNQSDMLIAYSTVPGFVSHRDPATGSWYIQAICKVFMEHAYDTDVENLLKIVDHSLAQVVSDGSKQTSSFENRGFKTCYLHPQLYV